MHHCFFSPFPVCIFSLKFRYANGFQTDRELFQKGTWHKALLKCNSDEAQTNFKEDLYKTFFK